MVIIVLSSKVTKFDQIVNVSFRTCSLSVANLLCLIQCRNFILLCVTSGYALFLVHCFLLDVDLNILHTCTHYIHCLFSQTCQRLLTRRFTKLNSEWQFSHVSCVLNLFSICYLNLEKLPAPVMIFMFLVIIQRHMVSTNYLPLIINFRHQLLCGR